MATPGTARWSLRSWSGRPTRTPAACKVLTIQDAILAGTQKPIGDAAAEIITRLLRKAPARNIL